MRLKAPALVVLALALLCGAAFAQKSGNKLTVHMAQSKISVNDAKKEVRSSADSVKPGEVIEYEVTYENTDSAAARNVVARLPIPQFTVLLPESPSPKNFEVSTDGARWGAYPLKRAVKNAAGVEQQVAVPDAELRFVRWSLGEIAPAGKKQVSARVRVLSNASATQKK